MKDELFIPRCFGHHESAWKKEQTQSENVESCHKCKLESFCKDKTMLNSIEGPARAVLLYLFGAYDDKGFREGGQQNYAAMLLAIGFGYTGTRLQIRKKFKEAMNKQNQQFGFLFPSPPSEMLPEYIEEYKVPSWCNEDNFPEYD